MDRVPGLPVLTAVMGLTLAAPAAAQGQEPVTMAVDTAAVLSSTDSLRSAYEQAVNEDDYERLGGLAAEDVRIIYAGDAAWDSVHAASEGPFPPGATLKITPMETRVLTGDWVYELGTSALTWTPEGGE